MQSGRVSLAMSIPEFGWSPQEAVTQARWLARLERALPQGARLQGAFGEGVVEMVGGTFDVRYASYEELLAEVARVTGMPDAERRAIEAWEPPVYTIGLASLADRSRAEAWVERFRNLSWGAEGPLTLGGFPALNPLVHSIPTASRSHLVTGVFLDRREADLALARLREEGCGGFASEHAGAVCRMLSEARVRRLDTSTVDSP